MDTRNAERLIRQLKTLVRTYEGHPYGDGLKLALRMVESAHRGHYSDLLSDED